MTTTMMHMTICQLHPHRAHLCRQDRPPQLHPQRAHLCQRDRPPQLHPRRAHFCHRDDPACASPVPSRRRSTHSTHLSARSSATGCCSTRSASSPSPVPPRQSSTRSTCLSARSSVTDCCSTRSSSKLPGSHPGKALLFRPPVCKPGTILVQHRIPDCATGFHSGAPLVVTESLSASPVQSWHSHRHIHGPLPCGPHHANVRPVRSRQSSAVTAGLPRLTSAPDLPFFAACTRSSLARVVVRQLHSWLRRHSSPSAHNSTPLPRHDHLGSRPPCQSVQGARSQPHDSPTPSNSDHQLSTPAFTFV